MAHSPHTQAESLAGKRRVLPPLIYRRKTKIEGEREREREREREKQREKERERESEGRR